MPTESEINRRIGTFLLVYFAQIGIALSRLKMKTEVVVSGRRATVRLPDLMVLTEELAQALADANRSLVTLDIPPQNPPRKKPPDGGEVAKTPPRLSGG